MSSKITIGSAQFGLEYGINNNIGKVQDQEVFKILNLAFDNNIKSIDTASAYGNSENVLGNALKLTNRNFDIISKMNSDGEHVLESLKGSLDNLNVSSLYGYLFHDFKIYLKDKKAWDKLVNLKKLNLVKKVGFSIYETNELDTILNDKLELDIIQIPYNVFDRKFEKYFERLVNSNVEIHVRSIFVQGLLFKDINTLPSYLEPLKKPLTEFHNLSKEYGHSTEQICLHFALDNNHINNVIIGLDSCRQLEDNINEISKTFNPSVLSDINDIMIDKSSLLNPVNWK